MKSHPSSFSLLSLAGISSLLLCGPVIRADAANGAWTNLLGGSWAAGVNWNGGTVATGSGATADFSTLTLPAAPTVTLDGAQTVGTLNFADGGNAYGWTVNTGSSGPLTLAVSTGVPIVNVTNQSVTIGAVVAGGSGLAKAGAGTLVFTGVNTYSGPTTVSNGVVTYSGSGASTGTTNSSLYLGGATGRGVLNFNSTGSSTFATNASNFYIGGNGAATDTGAGAINQTAGTLNYGPVAGSYYMTLGVSGTNAYGSCNLSGGTLNIANADGIRIGYGGMGSFVQSGGTFSCARYFSLGGSGGSGNGVGTFTGGNATINASYRILIPDNAGLAVMNVGTEAGGTALITNLNTTGITMDSTAGGTGTLNLDSGTLQVGGPIYKAAAGSATVNLDGGTLQAGLNGITLITTGLSSVNVYKGGVTFDTQTNAATVSASLLATPGNGFYPSGGTLTVAGGGGSGYLGAPLVTVSGGSGSNLTAIATVAGGAVTNVVITCPGQNYLAGDVLSFAFAGGGATAAAGTFTHTVVAGDLAGNSGGLTKVGSGTLTLTGANTYAGSTIISNGVVTYSGTGSSSGTTSNLFVGAATGTGVLNMNSSGTLLAATTAGNFYVGGSGNSGDTGVGAVNQTSGTVTAGTSTVMYLTLGAGGSSTYGSYNLSGGTLNLSGGGGWRIGSGGLGSYVQSGGTMNCARYFVVGGNYSGGVNAGVATLTGGSATVGSGYYVIVGNLSGAKGTLNLGTEAGGGATLTSATTAGFYVGQVSGATGTLNLNSGTLTIGSPILNGSGATGTVNLNGGTIRAAASGIFLITNGLTGCNVFNGGVVFDTQTNAATVSAPLQGTAGNGVYPAGGVYAIASGGGSGYIGAPLVTVTNTGAGSGMTAIANVSGGVVTGVTVTSPGQNYAAGNMLGFVFAGGGATNPAATYVYTLTSADVAANGAGGLTKTGSGTLTLSGTNTYTGATAVSNGMLMVTGVLGTNATTVATGATLGGNGTALGAVTVQSGGTLQPGLGGFDTSTLTVGNSLTLAGNALFVLDRTNAQKAAQVAGLSSVAYGGTLTLTNAGPALQAGDSFTLFQAGGYAGGFASLVLPALTTGLVWNTNSLAVNGSLVVQKSGTVLTFASSENPSGYHDTITFAASLSPGTPTGTVQFETNGVLFDTETLSGGSATSAAISSLPRGTNVIAAIYSGDANYLGTTNVLNQVVTNHPPVAAVMTVTRMAGLNLEIRLSDIATNWSDADGDVVSLTAINLTATNGVNLFPINLTTNGNGSLVITNTAWLGYSNTLNVNDQFSYIISDGQGGTNTGSVNIVIRSSVTGTNSITGISGLNPNTLTAYGVPGFSYITERSTNLAAWVEISTNTAGTNGVISVTDTFGDLGSNAPPQAYYRLLWQP